MNPTIATRLAEIRVLLDSGEAEAAASAAAEFARTDGAAHAGAHMLGIAALRLGDLASAIRALEAADAARPDSRETQQALAIAYGRAGRLADAAFRIKQLAVLQPDPVLGDLLAQDADGDLSEAFLGAGANPQKGEGYTALAAGRYDLAARLLEAAAQVDPNDPAVPRLRAQALLGLGRLSEAADLAGRALRVGADRVDAELAWSDVAAAAGWVETSAVGLAGALEADPNHDAAAAAAAARCERSLSVPPWIAARIGPAGAPPDRRPVRRVGILAPRFADHPQEALLAAAAERARARGVTVRAYHAGGEAEARAAFALLGGADAAAIRDLAGVDHDSVARIWANDGLDLLIDATSPAGSRLTRALLARRVPVQIALNPSIEACDLGGFDYVLADAAAPATAFERRAVARVAGIAPHPPAREATVLPQPERDFPTIGLAAGSADADPTLLDALARTLAAQPGARLLLLDPSFGELVAQTRALPTFERHGVEGQVGVLGPSDDAERSEATRAGLAAVDLVVVAGPAPDLKVAADALAAGLPVVAWTPGPSAASAAAGLAAFAPRATLAADPIALTATLDQLIVGSGWRTRVATAIPATPPDPAPFIAWLDALLDAAEAGGGA